jgi:hypothetical protein
MILPERAPACRGSTQGEVLWLFTQIAESLLLSAAANAAGGCREKWWGRLICMGAQSRLGCAEGATRNGLAPQFAVCG